MTEEIAQRKVSRLDSARRREIQKSAMLKEGSGERAEGAPVENSHEEMEADHAVGLLEEHPTMSEIERLRSELHHMKEKYNQEVPDLKAEVDMMKRRLKEKEQQSPLPYDAVIGNARKFKYFIGIDSEKFSIVFETLRPSLPESIRSKISLENQLFLTLSKLRLNLQFETIAEIYRVSKTTANCVFWWWIDLIYEQLRFLIKWPDHDAAMETLPHVFRQYFPHLTGIIDCTEIFIHRPKTLKARAQVYSN